MFSYTTKSVHGLESKKPKKGFVLSMKSWIYTLFFNFCFSSWFYWCHLQCSYSNLNVKSSVFSKKFYKLHGVGVKSRPPSTKRILVHSYLQITWAMCAQFNLKMICNISQEKEFHLISWILEWRSSFKKMPNKGKKGWCLNVIISQIDSMEWQTKFF